MLVIKCVYELIVVVKWWWGYIGSVFKISKGGDIYVLICFFFDVIIN